MVNAAVVGYGAAGRYYHSYLISLASGIDLYAIATRDPDLKLPSTIQMHRSMKILIK